jgi:hypothetical protein
LQVEEMREQQPRGSRTNDSDLCAQFQGMPGRETQPILHSSCKAGRSI